MFSYGLVDIPKFIKFDNLMISEVRPYSFHADI